MYLVTIENNGVETVINEVSTNTNNKVSGTIKQGINTINSFTFTILPNNQGYNLINPMTTLVKVLNTKTNEYEFIGRVLIPTCSMSNDGLVSKSYVCESELAYLLDTQQVYEEIHNITVRGYLEKLIKYHNANTDLSKQFVVGNVDVVDSNDSLYRYIAYDTTKKNIEDDLIEKLGGELQIRYENNIRYLDYLTEIGEFCNTEIKLAKNLQDIEQTIDISQYCNRLIVLGAKFKIKDDEGNEVDTEKRLTIEDVNNGLIYIDDEESILKYGVIQGQVIYDDVTNAKNLLSKGQKYLLNQRISISNKVNALDLSLIDIDIDSFKVGNYYPLIHEILGINDIVRIVEKSISIDSPHSSTITLGTLKGNIKDYYLSIKTNYLSEIKKFKIDFNDAVSSLDGSVSSLDGSVSNLSNTVSNLESDLNSAVSKLESDIEDLKNPVNDDYYFDITDLDMNMLKQKQSIGTYYYCGSMDIDEEDNLLYAEVYSGNTSSVVPGSTIYIRTFSTETLASSSRISTITLKNFGICDNFCIEKDEGATYIWIGCQGVADSDGYYRSTKICRFEYITGKTYTNTTGVEYDLLPNHTHLSPSIDIENNQLLIQSIYNGVYYYTVFDLQSVKNGNPIQIKQIQNPTPVNASLQKKGHDILEGYIYIWEGGIDSNLAILNIFDFNGKIVSTKVFEDGINVIGSSVTIFKGGCGGKVKKVSDNKYRLYNGVDGLLKAEGAGYLYVFYYSDIF